MKYSQLFKILNAVSLSPEQTASRFGLSGMTLRRWRKMPPNEKLPEFYEKIIVDGMARLIQENHLSPERAEVQTLLKDKALHSFEGMMKEFGVTPNSLQEILHKKGSHNQENTIISGLARIGSQEDKIEEVHRSQKKILSFKHLSREWSQRISTLLKVVRSHEMTVFEKFAAYGALFYLIYPLDLIPDHLPAFGLIDDFAIIGFATAYYLKRFQRVVK